ncbi:MAG: SUMF1/EgtB/PvdO family nonheme iron enzyme, partial [bacterium]|nr:SUMF1/EgtB/PvdO family nonheme iron enzyme [Candidatus Minthenecus merdequi]
NFVSVNLVAGGDAEIWVNGEKKGSGNISVDLTPGEYTFETRKASHRSQSIVRNITMESGGTIDLPAPVAIMGTLMVNIKPVGADIMVDGHKIGESPMLIENVLIGTHDVVISKAGCAERRERVTVTEGQTTTLDGKLSEGQDVRLSCGVPAARWTIDGVDRGMGAEIMVNLSYAEHNVEIKAEEYKDFSERFTVGIGTTNKSFAIQKIIQDVETITVNGVTFRMRLVEGGTFQMGSKNGASDEKPVHSVTLSDYYIGETEVTQAMWQAVMGSNPSEFKGDNLPVEMVSWDDCQEFISKLNQKTGRRFALPTEAQWEFAARGGNKSRGYEYSGSNDLDKVGWNWNNSGDRKTTGNWSEWSQVSSINCRTHPVGNKQANELGLYDMSGNVWEWCSDWKGSYSSSSQTDPVGPSSGSCRVLRGGSWRSNASFCRSTARYGSNPGGRGSNDGFRLVLLF